jgi:methylglutaconyl-CoA hydratase
MLKNTVLIQQEERWAWVSLNRPEKRNALNSQLIAELTAALDELERKPEVRVILLTGEGKAFCSGLDLEALQQMRSKSFEESLEDSRRYAHLLKRIYLYSKPVLAVLNGAAIAGGCGLASVCDFTLAADTAKLGYTEAKIGFVAAVVSYFLIRCVGEKRSRDLLLTARLIDPSEALRFGLVNEVIEPAQLIARARELARQLCENSSQSLRASKALLAKISSPDLDAALDYACELNAASRSSADCIEGIAAFLGKRSPNWE